MDISAKKLELLDWLMHINDVKVLLQVEKMRDELSVVQRQQPVFGRLKGQLIVAPDFDAPLDDFKEYME